MYEYTIEFTTTVTVKADSEEEAVRKAYDMVDVNNLYVYVNGKEAN